MKSALAKPGCEASRKDPKEMFVFYSVFDDRMGHCDYKTIAKY